MQTTADLNDVIRVLKADHNDPFVVLGAHKIIIQDKPCVAIRSYHPEASAIEVIHEDSGQSFEMTMLHDAGFFEVVFSNCTEIFNYRLRLHYWAGHSIELHDPYSFLPYYTDFDLHLFGEGSNYRIYEKMGAHPYVFNNVSGVYFSVWAPAARRVSVIGEFNQWDGRRHQMRILGSSGIWELFIPGLSEGDHYKFEIKSIDNFNLYKADPFAFKSELRPRTASVVYDYDKYSWNDEEWMKDRAEINWAEQPILIYELHLGSWLRQWDEENRWITYEEMAEKIIPYIKHMGYTHIEILPVSEHPFDGSWGYQVTGYFAPTSRFGSPDGFKYFVDRCHQEGIGIIVDWVPAHFPKDSHALGRFDGTCVYEHADPRQGEHQDWGTFIFNYGRHEVKNFLISNAVYWFEKYHIDGLRIDAVASMLYLDYSRKEGEWIPNKYGGRENLEAIEFIKQLNDTVYSYVKGAIMIAEESTAWPMVSRPVYIGGLGFGFKWNMGWMNDILSYFKEDPIYRKYHHGKLTFALWYAFTENFVLSISHDEVVHGKGSLINKMPGSVWQKFANLRLFFAYMYAHPGKKLHFMGGEIAQWKEWNHDSSLDWGVLKHQEHKHFHEYMRELNHFYVGNATLWEVDFDSKGFEWIDFSDGENSVLSFIRYGKKKLDYTVCVFNFTPIPRINYKIGVPHPVFYKEIFNSDAEMFGGANYGNLGGVYAGNECRHNHYHSIDVTIPPFGAIFFKPDLSSIKKSQEETENKVEEKSEKIKIDKNKIISDKKIIQNKQSEKSSLKAHKKQTKPLTQKKDKSIEKKEKPKTEVMVDKKQCKKDKNKGK
jgi:1,4-alpha-glucan branching enzyme